MSVEERLDRIEAILRDHRGLPAGVRDLDVCPKCGRSLIVVITDKDECFTIRLAEHRTPDRKSWCGLTMWRRRDGHH